MKIDIVPQLPKLQFKINTTPKVLQKNNTIVLTIHLIIEDSRKNKQIMYQNWQQDFETGNHWFYQLKYF